MYQSPVVMDQIAVVVGKHPIKTSDIMRDLRVTQFLNNEPLKASDAVRKASAQRLIDQELIRKDIEGVGNTSSMAAEASALYNQLVHQRFNGSEPQLLAELQKRALTKEQLLQQLQWQLTVLRFIDERFRPGVVISDEDVHKYYSQHAVDTKWKDLKSATFEAAAPQIRETLEAEQINRDFETWIAQARKNTRIIYKLQDLKDDTQSRERP
jgi:hypothetical protein